MSYVVKQKPMRNKVLELEALARKKLLSGESQPPEVITTHFFADKMYARVLFRPAGTLIVGKVHKREHFYICTKGKVKVTGNDDVTIIEAGAVIVSKPGTKRAVFALVDSICMTVHRTDETDLDKIEAELIEPDSLALFDSSNKLKTNVLDIKEVGKVGT